MKPHRFSYLMSPFNPTIYIYKIYKAIKSHLDTMNSHETSVPAPEVGVARSLRGPRLKAAPVDLFLGGMQLRPE